MKRFPHEPDAKRLEAIRDQDRSEYQSLLAGIPKAIADKNSAWLFSAWRTARNLALLEYAFDGPISETCKLLATSCAHADQALDLGYALDPTAFNLFLCMADICNHQGLRQRLQELTRSQYTDPGKQRNELAYLVAEIVADLSADRPKRALVRLPVALARARTSPSKYAVLVGELLMAQAILERSSQALDGAAETKIKAHVRRYSSADVQNHPGGLLDVFALGMVRIAQRYDLTTEIKSVYLPLELLQDASDSPAPG
jgi:hypothetical protein